MKFILKKIPLYESFDFDSEDENFDAIIESHRYKKFLEDNYDIKGVIRPYKKDGVLFIDIDGKVMIKNEELTSLTNGMFCFGIVKGGFDCSYCESLTSLEGAPKEVGGPFICYSCTSLETLEGAPRKVGKSFDCDYCNSLTSLKGAPKEVGGYFSCSYCYSLKSLKGIPKEIGGNFYCYSLKIDIPTTTKIKGEIFK